MGGFTPPSDAAIEGNPLDEPATTVTPPAGANIEANPLDEGLPPIPKFYEPPPIRSPADTIGETPIDTGLGLIGEAVEGPILKGAAGIAGRVGAMFTGQDSNAASAAAKKAVEPYIYKPTTPGGQAIVGGVNKGAQWLFGPTAALFSKGNQAVEHALGPTAGNALDEAEGTAGDIMQAAPVFGAASKVADITDAAAAARATNAARASYEVPSPPEEAEANLARQTSASARNAGAAATPQSLEGASPGLRQAVANAKNINPNALTRQYEADTLPQPDGVTPMSLRAGSATGDSNQISLERNLRGDEATQGLLAKSIDENDAKLGSSFGEIRRRATPDIVQRSTQDNAQTAIDAIKSYDNDSVLDIRAKYKALADQNGGAMPIDAQAATGAIQGALSKGYLTKTAAQNPVISEVMDALNSDQPLTFEQFENARTNLAGVQRGADPAAAKAAAIVRNGLENMPLSEEAANLKGLADTARKAAKTRFDTIEQNPAYKAVVNDNVPKDENGLHVIGAPSPLADKFMDAYFLGDTTSASSAYVARMQALMKGNPDFAPAVEASALRKLGKSAGLDENDQGKFATASYTKALATMGPKANVLMSPQSVKWTAQLGRVAGYENGAGKAATIGHSNTAIAAQQLAEGPSPGREAAAAVADHAADLATHLVTSVSPPIGIGLSLAKRVGVPMWKKSRAAKAAAAVDADKLKFAKDATAPGAGIDSSAPIPAGRASGGAVPHLRARTDAPPRVSGPSGTPKGHAAHATSGSSQAGKAPHAAPGTAHTHRKGSGTGRTSPDVTPEAHRAATSRARGGKVDHEALVNGLMSRWHAARKAASKHTEPLLNESDDTIQKALAIAGRTAA